MKPDIAYSAGLRFRGERHHDRERPAFYFGRMLELFSVIEEEPPASVKRSPFVALELRAGVRKIQSILHECILSYWNCGSAGKTLRLAIQECFRADARVYRRLRRQRSDGQPD